MMKADYTVKATIVDCGLVRSLEPYEPERFALRSTARQSDPENFETEFYATEIDTRNAAIQRYWKADHNAPIFIHFRTGEILVGVRTS